MEGNRMEVLGSVQLLDTFVYEGCGLAEREGCRRQGLLPVEAEDLHVALVVAAVPL